MIDLSLISEDELLDEIQRRNDCFVFASRKILSVTEKTERKRTFFGDKDACIGLCSAIIEYILKDTWVENS